MAKPASEIAAESASESPTYYEQPVSERMRTFMRLEFLYQQMLYSCERESDWGTRATIAILLEIMAILSRGDVRSEVHIGTSFMQPLKDSDFLNAIKNRSAIPGGTCEFDLPEYSHWLRQSFTRRSDDMEVWIGAIRPLSDAVTEVLWLIRQSAQAVDKLAINGMYQHNMQKDAHCRLLRINLLQDSSLYPEISGSQHRFTVRFLEWSTLDSRAVQTGHDVPFQLSIC